MNKQLINVYLAVYYDNKHHPDHPYSASFLAAGDEEEREATELNMILPNGKKWNEKNTDGTSTSPYKLYLHAIKHAFDAFKPVVEVSPSPVSLYLQTCFSSTRSVVSRHIAPAIRRSVSRAHINKTPGEFIEQVLNEQYYLDRYLTHRELVLDVIKSGIEMFRLAQERPEIDIHLYKSSENPILKEMIFQCRREALYSVGITNFRHVKKPTLRLVSGGL